MADILSIQDIFNLSGSPIDILFNFVLPIPAVAYAIYLLLGEIKLMNSPTARALFGIAVGVMVVNFLKLGSIALWGGIFGILLFKVKNLPGRIMGAIIFFFIVSQIISFNLSNPSTQSLVLIIFGVVMLFALVSTEDWKKQILMIAVLVVFYIVMTTYIISQIRI